MAPVVWRELGSVQIGLGGPGRVLTGLTEEETTLLLRAGDALPIDLRRYETGAPRWRELKEWLALASAPPPMCPVPKVLPVTDAPLESAIAAAALRARPSAAPATQTVHVLANAWVSDPFAVRRLMAADLPHLPVTADDRGLTIGPLVVPGDTACTRCLDLHRTDADPRWPMAATQLRITKWPPVSRELTEAATGLALLALRPGAPVWRIEHVRVGEVRVEPHPECGCITPPCGDGPGPA